MRVKEYIKRCEQLGLRVIRQNGSHKIITTKHPEPSRRTYIIGVHDREDLGGPMLSRLNKGIGVDIH